jgi:hypothetical protein
MGSSKELSILWTYYKLPEYNENNTVILDDYVEDVYKNQKQNCIIAKPFEFKEDNSHKDKFLKELQHKLRNLVLKKPDELRMHIDTINDNKSK